MGWTKILQNISKLPFNPSPKCLPKFFIFEILNFFSKISFQKWFQLWFDSKLTLTRVTFVVCFFPDLTQWFLNGRFQILFRKKIKISEFWKKIPIFSIFRTILFNIPAHTRRRWRKIAAQTSFLMLNRTIKIFKIPKFYFFGIKS